MLFYLAELSPDLSLFNVFRYITFRAGGAFITALISLPGTFFMTNDAFYFGVLPVLAKAAANYGVTAAEMGRAALIGQGSHLLSPLVASTYLLVGMNKVEFGDLQKFALLPAIGRGGTTKMSRGGNDHPASFAS